MYYLKDQRDERDEEKPGTPGGTGAGASLSGHNGYSKYVLWFHVPHQFPVIPVTVPLQSFEHTYSLPPLGHYSLIYQYTAHPSLSPLPSPPLILSPSIHHNRCSSPVIAPCLTALLQLVSASAEGTPVVYVFALGLVSQRRQCAWPTTTAKTPSNLSLIDCPATQSQESRPTSPLSFSPSSRLRVISQSLLPTADIGFHKGTVDQALMGILNSRDPDRSRENKRYVLVADLVSSSFDFTLSEQTPFLRMVAYITPFRQSSLHDQPTNLLPRIYSTYHQQSSR